MPSWLGGIDHPEALLPEFEIDDVSRRILHFLDDAPLETLVEEYLVKSFDSFEGENQALLTVTSAFLTLSEVETLEEVSSDNWIAKDRVDLPERESGEKWSNYQDRCDSYMKSLGLIPIKNVLDDFISLTTIRDSYQVPETVTSRVPMARRMKARRRHLLSIVPLEYEPDLSSGRTLTPWSVKNGIQRKLGCRLVHKDFMAEIGITNIPSFHVTGIRR
jgi:hypothetical protein